jgi:hypothetical protein
MRNSTLNKLNYDNSTFALIAQSIGKLHPCHTSLNCQVLILRFRGSFQTVQEKIASCSAYFQRTHQLHNKFINIVL